MTKQEAYKAMENGSKITHPNFASDEFYHLINGKIMAEDRVNHTHVFWDNSGSSRWRGDGWEIKQEATKPKDFYFTFGDIHETLTGIRMAHRWVRVTAPDYGAARECFCEQSPDISFSLDPGFKNFWEHIWPLLLEEFKREEQPFLKPLDLQPEDTDRLLKMMDILGNNIYSVTSSLFTANEIIEAVKHGYYLIGTEEENGSADTYAIEYLAELEKNRAPLTETPIPKELKTEPAVMCHRCNKAPATTFYGSSKDYPSCQHCCDHLNDEFDREYQ